MSERTPFIVGNWKMFKTIPQARDTLTELRAAVHEISGVECGVAPPFPALNTAHDVLEGSGVVLAAQNLYPEDEGAFTGEVSAPMLKAAGVTHVILGHSERRQIFGEGDDFVARKVEAALDHEMVPILCVGETREQRAADDTVAVVTAQLSGSLARVQGGELPQLVVAYEPVWAIGTGLTATPEQAQQVHAIIRDSLSSLLGATSAAMIRIQYGGSVKPDNAAELLAQPDIDGALVGGASLAPDSFAAIIRAAVAG
ncbi:MAG: triose-phosphate isomerase [Acidobacteriota bacterium]|jgi:triosephosphate isomerase